MATVADLAEQVREILRQELDADTSDVEDVGASGRIGGFVISERFFGLDAIDRQHLVWSALRAHLDPALLSQVGLLLTVTRNEADAVREEE